MLIRMQLVGWWFFDHGEYGGHGEGLGEPGKYAKYEIAEMRQKEGLGNADLR